MPFYTKPLSHQNAANLQELVNDRAVENLRLFKLKIPEKEDTQKKLSAFANTLAVWLHEGQPVVRAERCESMQETASGQR